MPLTKGPVPMAGIDVIHLIPPNRIKKGAERKDKKLAERLRKLKEGSKSFSPIMYGFIGQITNMNEPNVNLTTVGLFKPPLINNLRIMGLAMVRVVIVGALFLGVVTPPKKGRMNDEPLTVQNT